MTSKKEKVMEALSSRGKFSQGKKGVNLLGIVQKLSAKRKEAKGEKSDGKGGPGDINFSLSHIPGNLKKTKDAIVAGAKKVYNSHVSLKDIGKGAMGVAKTVLDPVGAGFGVAGSIANKLQKNRTPIAPPLGLGLDKKSDPIDWATMESPKTPKTMPMPAPMPRMVPSPGPTQKPAPQDEFRNAPMPNKSDLLKDQLEKYSPGKNKKKPLPGRYNLPWKSTDPKPERYNLPWKSTDPKPQRINL